jgi:cysteine synthase A
MHIGVLESNLSGSGFEGLQLAKLRGLHVTFFTRDLQRYLDVPGSKPYFERYVDDVVVCETNDYEALARRVEEVHARSPFDAFMTMGEYDVVHAARMAQQLGLPTVDPDAVAIARNKARMRGRCARHGVPMPAFGVVTSVEDARAVIASVGLPCIVKPVDETSSTDVVRCGTVRAAEEHVLRILQKQRNTRGQPRVPAVLIEECIRGHEVSVEVLAQGERFHVLGVTDKSVGGQGHFVEIGHVFPSLLPGRLLDDCAGVAIAALRAVGFDLGLAHVEVKIDEDGPKLVEINPRPAGDKITELVDHSLGIRCLDLMIGQYLGDMDIDRLTTMPQAGAAMRYLVAVPGRVRSVSGVEIARGMPGVVEVTVKADPGTRVAPLERNGDRQGHVMVLAADAYTAARVADAAAHEIVIDTVPDHLPPRRAVATGLAELVGRTPTIQIPVHDAAKEAIVVAKLEMCNPLSSVKDRAALHMLRAAEHRGDLIPGTGTIVEATSGNTGIALAGLAAAGGYRCVIVLPDSATVERVRLLRALGAEVVLTPKELGYPGAIERAERIHRQTPGSWFPRQHENLDNVHAHYETTAPELWSDLDGSVDVLVCGVGTGGTLTGVARYLKERNPRLRVIAVEPARSPVLSGGRGGMHGIPGFNGGFIAATTDLSLIDEIVTVSDDDAMATARRLARETGLFVGISSGAAVHVSADIARRPASAGATIATILPDSGERYLSVWQEMPSADARFGPLLAAQARAS